MVRSAVQNLFAAVVRTVCIVAHHEKEPFQRQLSEDTCLDGFLDEYANFIGFPLARLVFHQNNQVVVTTGMKVSELLQIESVSWIEAIWPVDMHVVRLAKSIRCRLPTALLVREFFERRSVEKKLHRRTLFALCSDVLDKESFGQAYTTLFAHADSVDLDSFEQLALEHLECLHQMTLTEEERAGSRTIKSLKCSDRVIRLDINDIESPDVMQMRLVMSAVYLTANRQKDDE